MEQITPASEVRPGWYWWCHDLGATRVNKGWWMVVQVLPANKPTTEIGALINAPAKGQERDESMVVFTPALPHCEEGCTYLGTDADITTVKQLGGVWGPRIEEPVDHA